MHVLKLQDYVMFSVTIMRNRHESAGHVASYVDVDVVKVGGAVE